MNRIKTIATSRMTRRLVPVAFVGLLGVGAAACGSSGSTHVQNSPSATTTPAATSPSTTAPSSGGAGF